MPFTDPQPGKVRATIDSIRDGVLVLEQAAAGDPLILAELELMRFLLNRLERVAPAGPRA
jgi:hypothetical protein